MMQKRVTTAIFSVSNPPVFDKRDIREGLGGGCGHRAMIPLKEGIRRKLLRLLTDVDTDNTAPTNKLLGPFIVQCVFWLWYVRPI